MKADLAGGHGRAFEEVGPGRVDDCYIVFFIAYVWASQREHRRTSPAVDFFVYKLEGQKVPDGHQVFVV